MDGCGASQGLQVMIMHIVGNNQGLLVIACCRKEQGVAGEEGHEETG